MDRERTETDIQSTGRAEAFRERRFDRFHPRQKIPGRWVGMLALGLVALSIVLHEIVGVAPAIVSVSGGIYAAKRGVDSRGRGFATAALIA